MGRIQSNVGLITGIPITDTIDQLMGVASRPRDLLTSRSQGIQQEQVAINSLSSRLLSLKLGLSKLKITTPYNARSIASQDESVLTATISSGGSPPLGDFALQPVQTASSQQLISQRFDTLDDIQSTGSFSFGFGGFVDKGISLDDLNDGTGVSRGEIKITDLDGNSSVIDLSLARTVDDVLDAINHDTNINVTAAIDGDRFTLTDNVGTSGNLRVEEVSGGTTAAELGLIGVTTSSQSEIGLGADVYGLHAGTKISRLNNGNGVKTQDGVDDLFINFTDETLDEVSINLSDAKRLSDVLDAINNHEDLTGKVSAAISADGNRLELTDSTTGSGTFAVTSGVTGSTAEDLGLTTTESGGVITGARLISGLNDTLTSILNGGKGLGTLGKITLTDRSSSTPFIVDLGGSETLSEIIDLINAAGTNITASINDAGSGLLLTDTVGGSGNLIVANHVPDGLETADVLGITVDAAQDSIDSSSLDRQILSEATLLSSLSGGEGITPSDISITDSGGATASVDLNASGNEAKTIGDVIDAINSSSVDVTARINDTGDGILLIDNANGSGVLGVKDVNGTLGADLNLTRASTTANINGADTQVVDGTNRFSVDLSNIEGSVEGTSLSSLNNGRGISFSDFRIIDSADNTLAFDFNGKYSGLKTIGQLIDAINDDAKAQGVKVTASINSAGTGILLTDTAGGFGELKVEDINGTAASDLRLLKTAESNTIDGTGLFSSQSANQGALSEVADRINELESGVTASVLNDGIGFRLQLIVDKTGAANEILIEEADAGFSFRETSTARDALLVAGGQGTPGSGVLVSSSSNEFVDVVEDVDLTVLKTSDTPITVSVDKSDEGVITAVEGFVESYNTIRSDLDQFTDFNETDFTTGLLFGTNEALRVESDLSQILTQRFFGLGSFQTFEEVGLSVDAEGKLELNKTKFKEAFVEDPAGLQNFFADSSNGVVAKFEAAIERLAGEENGLLTNRNDSLQATIDNNNARIEQFNEQLERQRQRLELQFFQLEQTISKLQVNQQALGAIRPIPALGSSSA